MKRTLQSLVLIAGLGALAGLAGCSHSCVPAGWYGARSVAAAKQPPNAPPIHHSDNFAIPGGAPHGKPSRAQACLVEPPDVLANQPATAAQPAKTRQKP